MLKKLYIQNYALISKLELTFNSGLNVITGETGAGKSIIIGALGLILGNRSDTTAIKNQKAKCIVEGIFNSLEENIILFLTENNLDIEPELYIRREISTSGKSRAFINDTPVSLSQLKELAGMLVDINSQNQTYIFKKSEHQLSILDKLENNNKVLQEYQNLYQDYILKSNKLEELKNKENKARQQKDFLEFQFNELAEAELQPNEDSIIKAELDILNNSETIKNQLYIASQSLSQNDDNIIHHLENLLSQISKLGDFSTEYLELYKRLRSSLIEIQDIASEYERLNEEAEFDPEHHSSLTERMDTILRLQQKHRKDNVDELLELQNEIDKQLQGFVSIGEQIKKAEELLQLSKNKLSTKAKELSSKRKKQIPKIEKSITNSLQQLGMKDATFIIDMQNNLEFSTTGTDKISFLFSSNKGHKADYVSKIASGGELSRLVLSLKSLLSSNRSLPTVIFDEIDSGVSGDIATKVGQIMNQMADNMQVIAITHLHQIAAKAKWHFKVYKKEVDNITLSDIRQLNDTERLNELALMISGDTNSSQALKMAAELINSK